MLKGNFSERDFMNYIAEVLKDDQVWLLNENRRLLSIHRSVKEAREVCRQRYDAEPRVVDRRQQMSCSS